MIHETVNCVGLFSRDLYLFNIKSSDSSSMARAKKRQRRYLIVSVSRWDGGAANGVTGRLIVFRGFDPIASRSKAPYSTKIYYVVSHFIDSEGVLMARFF